MFPLRSYNKPKGLNTLMYTDYNHLFLPGRGRSIYLVYKIGPPLRGFNACLLHIIIFRFFKILKESPVKALEFIRIEIKAIGRYHLTNTPQKRSKVIRSKIRHDYCFFFIPPIIIIRLIKSNSSNLSNTSPLYKA